MPFFPLRLIEWSLRYTNF